MEGKGKTGRWTGNNVSKKSVMLVVYIYYASFSPHHYAPKKEKKG